MRARKVFRGYRETRTRSKAIATDRCLLHRTAEKRLMNILGVNEYIACETTEKESKPDFITEYLKGK